MQLRLATGPYAWLAATALSPKLPPVSGQPRARAIIPRGTANQVARNLGIPVGFEAAVGCGEWRTHSHRHGPHQWPLVCFGRGLVSTRQ
jgi:hypothetical protein